MRFTLDDSKVPDLTVLMIGARFENQTSDKVWTYALLKAGGRWYVTGSGKVPTDAGWGAVANWLERDGRIVQWVRLMTGGAELYRLPSSPAS